MSFHDDVYDREPADRRPKIEVHTIPVPPGKFERAAMAGFCESLSPEDWLLLESMGPRLRNALLKQTIAIAMRWRKRRSARKPTTTRVKE
jgi:hypothetical protein